MENKTDIVIRAFAQARISGLTSTPSAKEIEVGLEELEEMLAEWQDARGAMLGFNFSPGYTVEDDEHNLPKFAIGGVVANLALRLLDYYGKDANPGTVRKASSGWSAITTATYVPQDVAYPSRMPVGSGNLKRGYYRRKFYPGKFNPETDNVKRLYYQDKNNYVLDLSPYLNNESFEFIDTATVTSDNGIDVTITATNETTVDYEVEAQVNGFDNLAATFTIITTNGRQTTRVVYFNILTKSLG